MIKSFLIIVSFQILLFSSQQIILVVSEDLNTSKAYLEYFEDNLKVENAIEVNLGKNGLGWGLGENLLEQNSSISKYEGDKKAPAGIFSLSDIYGYSQKHNYKMPYLYTSQNLICVDDSNSPFYNHIIEANGDEKSFETMKRNDKQYELGVVVQHNTKAINKRGSCIFLHVEKHDGAPTAGCTSMSLKELQKIVNWLDKDKNPILIQIPKSSAQEVLKLYPQLKDSTLLHPHRP